MLSIANTCVVQTCAITKLTLSESIRRKALPSITIVIKTTCQAVRTGGTSYKSTGT